MGAPDVTASTSRETTATTSHTVDLPAGVASGDLLILMFGVVASETTTTPTGWTLVGSWDSGTDGWRMYRRVADGGEGSTVTVATDNARDSAHLVVRASVFGGSTLGYAFSSETTGTTGTQPDAPNLDPDSSTTRPYLWLEFVGCSSQTSTDSSPASYTLLGSISSGTSGVNVRGSWLKTTDQATENPGEDACSHSTHNWAAVTAAVWFSALNPPLSGSGGGWGFVPVG